VARPGTVTGRGGKVIGLPQVLVYAVVIAVAAYALVVVGMYVGQRVLMYPTRGMAGDPAAAGLFDAQEIQVETKDGLRLLSWYQPPTSGQPVIVYFHGNAGTVAGRAYKAAIFAKKGWGFLLVEYRGYGGNPGKPSETGLYEDARSNLAWLRGQGVRPEDMVIYGESLGTGVATHAARELARAGTPARGLILEAPFTSMVDVAAVIYPWLPVRRLIHDQYDSIGKIKEIAAPLLVVHGTADRTVPFDHGQRLFEAAQQPKTGAWLTGAGHVNVFDFGAADAIEEFVSSLGDKAEK